MFSNIGFRVLPAALAFVLSVAAVNANAQGNKTVLNAAITTYYPPFAYKEPGSEKAIGFNIDFFEAVAAKMGAKVNWIESSFPQLLPSIETKRADVAVGIG